MGPNVGDDRSVCIEFELLNRCRGGDQEAATEVFEKYVARLIGFARNRLSSRMQQRIDPEDVVQSVYRTFFSNVQNGRYTLERSGDLWRLLVGITYKKLHQQIERHTAEKRSIWLEQVSADVEQTCNKVVMEISEQEPTFEEAIAVFDELEFLLGGLQEHQRVMVGLRLQGASIPEIAQETCRSERTVRRVLEDFRIQLENRFQRQLADGP